jgi:hypothetical protein
MLVAAAATKHAEESRKHRRRHRADDQWPEQRTDDEPGARP